MEKKEFFKEYQNKNQFVKTIVIEFLDKILSVVIPNDKNTELSYNETVILITYKINGITGYAELQFDKIASGYYVNDVLIISYN